MNRDNQFDLETLEQRVLLSGDGLAVNRPDWMQASPATVDSVTMPDSPQAPTSSSSGLLGNLQEAEGLAPAARSESAEAALESSQPLQIQEAAVRSAVVAAPGGFSERAEMPSHKASIMPSSAEVVPVVSTLVKVLRAPNGPPEHPALSESASNSSPVAPETVNSPGNTPGVETISGAEAWSPTEEYHWNISAVNGGEGITWDLIDVTGSPGSLTINASKTQEFQLSINATGAVAGFDNSKSFTWRIVRTVGGIAGFDRAAFAINTSSFIAAGNSLGSGRFVVDLSVDSRDLLLRFLPSQETALLGTDTVNWVEEGPFKVTGNANTIIPPDNPVIGAVQAFVPHPTNPTKGFLAAVGGGVWRSVNFSDAIPTWEPIGDTLPSLGITALAVSPLDSHDNPVTNSTPDDELVIYAGLGSVSSSGAGGPTVGLYRTRDGGKTWNEVSGFHGIRITKILPSFAPGGWIYLSTINATATTPGTPGRGGLYRSADGTAWERLSGIGSLPEFNVADIIQDPASPGRLYAALSTFSPATAGLRGIYATNAADAASAASVTWSRFDAGIQPNYDHDANLGEPGELNLDGAGRIRLAISSGASQTLFAAIAGTDGKLADVFYSGTGSASWARLGAFGVAGGIPDIGSQANLHLSLTGDPLNPSIVYLAGTHSGASPYAGAIYRGDTTTLKWTKLTADKASDPGPIKTAPHADARNLAFAGNSNDLIATVDGGIYRMANPRPTNAAPKWDFIGTGLRLIEVGHGLAYDHNTNSIFIGTQDNGVIRQTGTLGVWTNMTGGDGAFVGASYNGTTTTRYYFSNNFDFLYRADFTNPANPDQSTAQETLQLRAAGNPAKFSGLENIGPVSGSKSDQQTITGFEAIPLAINRVQQDLILIGRQGIYRSSDKGDTLTQITDTPNPSGLVSALLYGGRVDGVAMPEVIYVVRGQSIAVRGPHQGEDKNSTGTFQQVSPAGGSKIEGIATDPNNWRTAIAVDARHIYLLQVSPTDGTITTYNITGNLGRLTEDFRSVEVLSRDGKLVVVVGTLNGVYSALLSDLPTLLAAGSATPIETSWSRLGDHFPPALVTHLLYDETDDVLIAATLGRGTWSIKQAKIALFQDFVLRVDTNFADDTIKLRVAPPEVATVPTLQVLFGPAETVLGAFELRTVRQIVVHTGGGNDTLIVDSTNGEIIVPDGIRFYGDEELVGDTDLDTLTFTGPTTSGLETRSEPGVQIRQMGSEIVRAVQVEKFTDTTFGEDFLAGLKTVWRVISWPFRTLIDLISPDVPVISDTLMMALNGGNYGEPKGVEDLTDGGPEANEEGESDELGGGQESSSLLERLFEGAGFDFEDIGSLITSGTDLQNRLDALDDIAGNVVVDVPGKRLSLGIAGDATKPFRRRIEAEVPVSTELFGGVLKLNGMLKLSVAVDLHLEIGMDSRGFYVANGGAIPEVRIHDLEVEGDVAVEGNFGIVRVILDDAEIEVGSGVGISIDLVEPADAYGHAADTKLRGYDLLQNPLGWMTFALTGDTLHDDLTFTTDIRIAGVEEDGPPLFDLPIATLKFAWADISRPQDVRVEPVGGPADILMRLLSFTPNDLISELDRLLQSVDALQKDSQIDIKLPFGGGVSLRSTFDFAKALRDKVYNVLSDAKLVSSTGGGNPTGDLALGRLSANAEFTLDIGEAKPTKITVTKSSTSTNHNLQDLVDDINTGISNAGLGTKVRSYLDGRQIGLRRLSGGQIKITGDSSNPAFTEIGFSPNSSGIQIPKLPSLQAMIGELNEALDPDGPGPLEFSITPAFDLPTKRLTFALALKYSITKQADFKAASDLGLGSLADFSATGKFLLGADLSVGFTLGIDFGAAKVPELRSNFLVPAPASGKLTAETDFTVVLNDGQVTDTFHLDSSLYGVNTSVKDLVDDLNFLLAGSAKTFQGQALKNVVRFIQSGNLITLVALNETDANGNGVLEASEDTNGDGIRQLWLDKVYAVAVQASPNSTAATEMGFTPGNFARSGIFGVFVQDVALSAKVAINGTGLGANATYAVFGIKTSGGEIHGKAEIALGLKNPKDGTTRIDIGQLFSDLGNAGSYIAPGLTFSGDLKIDLKNIQVTPALFDPFPTAAAITLFIPDLKSLNYNPDPYNAVSNNKGIFITFPDLHGLGDFNCLTFLDVVHALDGLADQLEGLKGFGFLAQPIPLINLSISDILDFAGDLADAIKGLATGNAGTLADIESTIEGLFGLGPNVLTLSVEHTDSPVIAGGTAKFNPSGPKNALKFTGPNGTKIRFIADNGDHLTANTDTAASDWNATDKVLTIYFNAGYTTASTVDALADKGGTTISLDTGAEAGAGPGAINTTVLKLKLAYSLAYGNFLPLQLSLADLVNLLPAGVVKDALSGISDLVQIEGSAKINVTASADMSFELGIDVSNPCDWIPFVNDAGTQLSLNAAIRGTALNFKIAVGALGIFVKDGTVTLDGDGNPLTTNDNASFQVSLKDNNGDGRHYFRASEDWFNLSNIGVTLTAVATARLPLYFPTASLPAGGSSSDGADTDTFPDNWLTIDVINLGTLFDALVNGTPMPSGILKISTPDLTKLFQDFNACDLITNASLLLDGLDTLLGSIQSALSASVFNRNLPLVGDKLGKAADVIGEFREGLLADLREKLAEVGDPIGLVKQAIFNALGKPGLDILTQADGSPLTSFDQIDIACASDAITFNLRLKKSVALVDTSADPIHFDVGIPGFGLEVDGNVKVEVGFDLKLKFGISAKDGFYMDTSNPEELRVEFKVTIPGLHAAGRLLFLQLDVSDESDGVDALGNPRTASSFAGYFSVDIRDPIGSGNRLTFNDLLNSGVGFDDIVHGELGAKAELNLDFAVSFGGDARFPRLVGEFDLDWAWSLGGDADGTLTFGFHNIQIDIGSFISQFIQPILNEIKKVTEPFQPLIDTITTPIPIISDIFGKPVTMLDLAEMSGYLSPSTVKFIKAVAKIISLANHTSFSNGSILIPLGSFNLDLDSDGTVMRKPGDPNPAAENLSTKTANPEAKSFLQDLEDLGFTFPFLSISEIFKLFSGQPISIVEYHMPVFEFQAAIDFQIPIYPPLYAVFGGQIGAKIDLTFGFDTYGLQKFFASEDKNPLIILDGFYVKDVDNDGNEVTEFTLSGGITAGAEVSLGFAEFGVRGGLFAEIGFDLNDPDNDGKVRASEIIALALEDVRCIFDIHGRLYVALEAYLKINLLFFSIDEVWRFGEITLAEFDLVCPQPVLADVDGKGPGVEPSGGPGVLTLHMGEYASLRENGDTSDGSESFTVVHIDGAPGQPDGETVEVSFNGIKQTYFGVKSIIVKAGAGNDRLDLRGVLSAANVRGGSGNDTLYAGRATMGNKFYGDDGDDVLVGEEADGDFLGANDEFDGGSGRDQLTGNEGDDLLSGGQGDDVLSGGDGADTMDGGSGNDSINGAAGNDIIQGGDGADEIEGNDGDDRINGGSGNDRILGGTGADWIIGGAGDDVIDGGANDDVLLGDDGAIVSLLKVLGIDGVGNDTVAGGAGNDTIFGAGGDDQIYGGTFLVDGESQVTGVDGRDFIDAGIGNDLVFADDAHSDQTVSMPGGTVGDLAWFDVNKNGIRDTGDNGVAGVKVELRHDDNTVAGQTTTNAAGVYKFTSLLPGKYYLVFKKPTGLQFTDADQGTDDTLDSDANTVTGRTAIFEIDSGATNLTLDVGFKGSLPTISIDNPSVVEGDDGLTTLVFTVSLSNPFSEEVSVCYDTVHGFADKDARAIFDYDSDSWTLIFNPGETTKLIEIAVHGDLIDELDEVFSVMLGHPNNGVIDALHGIGVGTIIDDDAAPVVTISDGRQISGVSPIPEVTPMTFRLTLSNPSYQAIRVDWRTQQIVNVDGSLASDSARAGIDYDDSHEYNAATVVFQPGEVQKTISIATKSDLLDEFDERFDVVIALNAATPTDGAVIGDQVGTGTILDDDDQPFVRINTLTPQPVAEGHAGNRTVVLEISLDAPSGRTVTVQWNTARGTALGAPVGSDPADYVYKFETVTFAEGVTKQNVFAQVIGDTILEPDEYFFANLLSANYAQIDTNILSSHNNHARIDIANDEVPDPGPWYVEFSDFVYTVTEGQTATITLVRAAGSTQPVAVYWTLGAPAFGTATPGVDYTDEFGSAGIWEGGKPGAAPRGVVRFGAGETIKTFQIRALSDTLYEGTEVALLALGNPTGGNVRAPQQVAALRILDAQPAPKLSINDPSITEGDAGTKLVTFTVTATLPTGISTNQPISVLWDTFLGTALPGADFVADSGTVNLPAFTTSTSATFTVKVVGDTVAELEEYFFARLRNPTNAVLSDYEGKATISDNDRQNVTGFVFNDLNGNGFFDADTEYGLDGVKVSVKDSSGSLGTKTTDDGKWDFDVLLGSITVTLDESTTPSDSECTTGNSPLTTTVTPTTTKTANIGYQVQPTTGKGSGNTASGNRGNNDAAYGGGGNDLMDGGNGDDWLVGGHWLGPACACDGDPYDATLKEQTLEDGGHRYVDPASLPAVGAILGRVWLDANGNNAQDEPIASSGIKFIQVNLYDDSWTLVGITYTDALGNYSFQKLAPCKYTVQFLPPAGHRFAAQDNPIGVWLNPDAIDSDANGLTGLTAAVAINGNTVDLDAGMSLIPNATTGPWAIFFDHVVYSVRESDGFATIGLDRVPNSFQPVAVYYTQDGDLQPATLSDPDYGRARGTVSFGAGETHQTFLVPVVNDSKVEGYEVVLLTLKNPTGGDVKGRPDVARLLIFDNPCPDDDEIHGGDGDDILLGDFGYFSSAGVVTLLGGLGNDTLQGDDGDDVIYGEGGNDTLIGGADDDQLDGGGENDTYVFDGDTQQGLDSITEVVSPFGGNDTIDLSSTTGFSIVFDLGSAALQNPTPSLKIQLPAGNVIENILGGSKDDILTGNNLDNLIAGNGGNDILEGLGGDDELRGGDGNDTYLFDADLNLGHDDLFEKANADVDLVDFSKTTGQAVSLDLNLVTSQSVSPTLTLHLHSKTGIEDLNGGARDDTLLGNDRDNRIMGSEGSDTLDGRAGYDTLVENRSGNFQLTAISASTGQLTLGAEVNLFALSSFEEISLVGDDNPNTLDASAFSGKVRLDGRGGDDVIKGGTGENILTGGGGNDVIVGLGNTTLVEERDADMVLTPTQLKIGATEVDTISGITVARLTGGASNNTLDATGFTLAGTRVELDGAGGNDTLRGSPGADQLTGGPGDDVLGGGDGDDTYAFDTDSNLGTDLISEVSGEGSDTVTFAGSQAQVVFNIGSAAVQAVNSNLALRITAADVIENLTGGDGGDRLIGNDLENTIRGGPGADELTGGKGSDLLVGGAGTDRVIEQADANMTLTNTSLTIGGVSDVLNGVETASLTGGVSNNILDALPFTLGGVTLDGGAGFDILRGGSKNDTLIGGAGDDQLIGFTGSDTYVFDLDGPLGNDSIIDVSGAADTLDFSQTAKAPVSIDLAVTVAQVVNPGRLTLTLTAVGLIENVVGGGGNDVLRGNGLANSLDGRGGDDSIEGRGGNDLLTGGDGDDTFLFDADTLLGVDTIREGVGTGGTDTLDFTGTVSDIAVNLAYGSAQVVVAGRLGLHLIYCHNIESVIGGAGNDLIIGNTLDNTLEGRGGNDTLIGLRGDDRYLFDNDAVLGTDTLIEQPDSEGGIDTLDFSGTSGVGVTVDLGNVAPQNVTASHVINLEWPPLDVFAQFAFENLVGGSGNDNLTGNALDNRIDGGAGNDTLQGAGGADTLIGDAGNDALAGGPGDDTYLFDADLPVGNDSITELLGGGIDTIDFSPTTTLGVTFNPGIPILQLVNANLRIQLSSLVVVENVVGSAAADTLFSSEVDNVMRGGPGDDTYVFNGDVQRGRDTVIESPSPAGGLDTITFQQTSTLPVQFDLSLETAQEAITAPGSPSVPRLFLTLLSGESIENLVGGFKDDTLVGNGLDNRISGGLGKDFIFGNGGNDTVVEARDADMVLNNTSLDIAGEKDTLKSIESAELTGGGSANKLNASTFTLGPVTLDGGFGADTLIGGTSSGDRVVVTRDADMLLTDTALKVGSETDSINGIEHATLTGGAGANKLDASAFTKGSVTLNGEGGADTLKGGKGNDELSGGSGDDLIDGGLGMNTLIEQRDADMKLSDSKLLVGLEVDLLSAIQIVRLTGGDGANQLDASACATVAVELNGGRGADVLKGGARSDILDGGDGDDTLVGGNGHDRYVFVGSWGDDTIAENDGEGLDTADFSGIDSPIIAEIGTDSTLAVGDNRTSSTGGSLEQFIGSSADDSFHVTPSVSLEITVDGGAGTNDSITYDPPSGVTTVTPTTFLTTGFRPVHFLGIESTNVVGASAAAASVTTSSGSKTSQAGIPTAGKLGGELTLHPTTATDTLFRVQIRTYPGGLHEKVI